MNLYWRQNMNFGRPSVEDRKKQFQGQHTHRLYRAKLISIFAGLLAFLFLCVFLSIHVLSSFQNTLHHAPDIDSIDVSPNDPVSLVVDQQGNELQQLQESGNNREYLSLNDIPTFLQNAFIAIEDPHFWTHKGVDFQQNFRSVISGIASGQRTIGSSSTITQKLLKNQIFQLTAKTSLMQSLQENIQEQYLSIQLEEKYSKSLILEYYLNTINLGQDTMGIASAAKRYFNKEIADLSLSEAAILAGIAENPTEYNPITHPAKNKKRQITVLGNMKEQGYITSEEYTDAIKDNVYDRIQTVNNDFDHSEKIQSYFTDALVEQVIRDLKEQLGYSETQAYNAIYNGGLTIVSTQDSQMQKICDTVINDKSNYPSDSKYQLSYQLTLRHSDDTEESFVYTNYYTTKKEARKGMQTYRKKVLKKNDLVIAESSDLTLQPQAAFVLMDQNNGQVLALCGGRNTTDANRTWNRGISSNLQPGTALSVLSSYLPALDTAGMTLATVQDDAEYRYPGTKQKVKNWNNSPYNGLTSIRSAIGTARNVVAVKTLNSVSAKTGFDYLSNLGFSTLVDSSIDSNGKSITDIALPLAVGKLKKGVTPLELTTAYATIANGGTYYRASFYTKVLDHNGNVLLDNSTHKGTRVMKESTAWLLTDAMSEGVNSGSATGAKFQSYPMSVAGSNGTTKKNENLWFVGYTPYFTSGIWCGYDDNSQQTDSNYQEKIWQKINEAIHVGYKNQIFQTPDSVTAAYICTKCGKLAVDGLCDSALGGSCKKQEYFAKDSVPTDNCDCHVRCQICKASGLLAGDNCPSDEIYTAIYLQKKESATSKDQTADSSLLLPDYLADSVCNVHN